MRRATPLDGYQFRPPPTTVIPCMAVSGLASEGKAFEPILTSPAPATSSTTPRCPDDRSSGFCGTTNPSGTAGSPVRTQVAIVLQARDETSRLLISSRAQTASA